MLPGLPSLLLSSQEETNLHTLSYLLSAFVDLAAKPNPVTIPAEAQVGDLLFLLAMAVNTGTGAPTSSAPAGWTSIQNINDGSSPWDYDIHTYAKIAELSDIGSALSATFNAATINAVHWLVVFRGNIPITSMVIGSPVAAQRYSTSGGVPARTVSVAGVTAPVIAIATYFANIDPISTRVFTIGGVQSMEGEIEAPSAFYADQFYIAWRAFNQGGVTPTNVVIDMSTTDLDQLMTGQYIAVS